MSEFDKLIKLMNDAQSTTAASADPRVEYKREIAIMVADSLEDRGLSHAEVIEILLNIIGATIRTAGIKNLTDFIPLAADIIHTLTTAVFDQKDSPDETEIKL